jgi:hypothetical protein
MSIMGRPRIEIDFDELDKLCKLQCTQEEIAGWFECSIDTIQERIKERYDMTFPQYFAMKRQGGKVSLRRKQFETAMKGNPHLLIWLGKQYLGQVDRLDQKIDAGAIKIVIDKDDSEL